MTKFGVGTGYWKPPQGQKSLGTKQIQAKPNVNRGRPIEQASHIQPQHKRILPKILLDLILRKYIWGTPILRISTLCGGSCSSNFKSITFKLMIWMSQNLTNAKLGFFHVIIWGRQETRNDLTRFESSSTASYAVAWPVMGHDDVIKWKHFPRYWPFVRGIHRSPMNFPHKGQWRGALIFSLICARINDWVNNCEAGNLRLPLWRHCNVI